MLGGLAPDPALVGNPAYFSFQLILIAQLVVGGFLVLLMDEVVSKWGFGSGVSLFIAAGVASEIFIRAFSPLISVYAQAMKVEIPLSFGRVSGYGVRWPLNFLYTSNIPVILIAALLANFQ